MAFESLSDKFQGIFKGIRGHKVLTEENINDVIKEIRIALLDADVNYEVASEFVDTLAKEAVGQQVFKKLSPGETMIKITYDALVKLLGDGDNDVCFNIAKPTVIMLVGLQGTGKTTAIAKLANLYQKVNKKKVLLVAGDIYRPAAIEQLNTLAGQTQTDIYIDRNEKDVAKIAKAAYQKALDEKYDVVLIDTAGRLEIDDVLMDELVRIEKAVPLDEELLLVDAMVGQNAVNVAKTFHEKVRLTGIIMSKLDGDARGGAALSIKRMTGLPIKYASVGEKISDLENFHPEGMANRILGQGDIIGVIEEIQNNIDEAQAMKTSKRLMNGLFDLTDMLSILKQMKKFSMSKLLRMIPGMPKFSDEDIKKLEVELKRVETIINSMTIQERKKPEIIKQNRKMRIAKGSGMKEKDVSLVLDKYFEMSKQMKSMKNGQMNPAALSQMMKNIRK